MKDFLKDNLLAKDDEKLAIFPCGEDDRVCDRPSADEEDYFYVYSFLFTRFSITLPFSPFICSVLSYLHFAPTQLMPNG